MSPDSYARQRLQQQQQQQQQIPIKEQQLHGQQQQQQQEQQADGSVLLPAQETSQSPDAGASSLPGSRGEIQVLTEQLLYSLQNNSNRSHAVEIIQHE
jgi:hypothetical protein